MLKFCRDNNDDQQIELKRVQGSKGNLWKKMKITMVDRNDPYSIVIEASVKQPGKGDIGIDDIALDENCVYQNNPVTTTSTTTKSTKTTTKTTKTTTKTTKTTSRTTKSTTTPIYTAEPTTGPDNGSTTVIVIVVLCALLVVGILGGVGFTLLKRRQHR